VKKMEKREEGNESEKKEEARNVVHKGVETG